MKSEEMTFEFVSDFAVSDSVTKDSLSGYGSLPYKVKSGLFLLCVRGFVKLSINLTSYTVKTHDFLTLVPNTFIQFEAISEDVLFYLAGFSATFMNDVNFIKSTMNVLPMITDRPVIHLDDAIAQLYIDGYQLLVRASAFSSRESVNKNLVIACMTIFMQSTAELYKRDIHWNDDSHTRKYEIYRRFVQLVVENYTKQHSVSFYAEQLSLSLPHFCTTIKKAIGLTPLEIISSILIMDAKAQLRETTMSVKEIAYSLGFTNLSFFNKYFRQHTGMTPREYRLTGK
ncbi:MAG: helix-turn-helix domain-containing protein [Parabacteroides sp.]